MTPRTALIALIAASVLGTWPKPAYAGACDELLTQDLNCNTKDVSDEALVDMDDPLCAENPDYTSGDYYYDYFSWGCAFPVDSFDTDGDGFSDGTLV